jgi:hypothetical protein
MHYEKGSIYFEHLRTLSSVQYRVVKSYPEAHEYQYLQSKPLRCLSTTQQHSWSPQKISSAFKSLQIVII